MKGHTGGQINGRWSHYATLICSVALVIFASLTLRCTTSDLIQSLTVQDLMTRKFPHLVSDDANMYPCKADIFEGDIILKRPHKRGYNGEQFDEQDRGRKRKKKRRKFQTRQNYTIKHERKIHQRKRSEAFRQSRARGRLRRAATARKERLWKHGIIPYVIEGNFSGEHRTLFKQAMRYWENYTCVQFVEKSSDHTNYIYFTQRSCGCCSFVGKRGNGGQAISIGKNCDKFGIVVHELGHVVGFWHEHTRPDRDQHVQILPKNILAGQEYNFNKLLEEEVNSLGLSYDYDSIMHYARNTFSKNTALDTILPKGEFLFLRPVIGQRIKLSTGDVAQTNKLYKCPKCGRTCQEPSGHLKSPGFESFKRLPNDAVFCEWRITATHGEVIALNVTELNVFSTPLCDTDYLEVRDGYWFKSALLGRFCGSSPVEERLVSTGHRMLVTYKASPGHYIYRGFQAKYDAICGGNIEKNEGILQSPNYPDFYRANKECIWTVTVTEGSQVALTFQAFEVETHDNCAYDYVEVRDGLDHFSPLLGRRLCGQKLPRVIRSSSNRMLVKFVSDSSVQRMGFSASFVQEKDECQATDHGCHQICVNTVGSYRCECSIGYELHSDGRKCEDACGGVFSSPSGVITSPSFPDLYPSNKHCSWEIVAPEKFTITLNFTHFDLEGANQNCDYDSIQIGSLLDNEEETKYGVYCGSHLPPVVTSKKRSIKIEFFSDNSVQKSGFAAVYSTDKDECASENGGCQHICKNVVGSYKCSCHNGFILHENKHDCKEGSCVYHMTGPRGEVSSPNYPDNYSSRRDCTWSFTTEPGHRIKLVFEEFDIESHQECSYDFVAFYDGKDVNSDSLGQFCGTKFPHPIISTGSDLVMTFKTDLSVQKKGFKAVYSTVCGGRLKVTSDVTNMVSHVKFGDQNYENNGDCNWSLTSANRKRIRISFRTFELEEEKNCSYDFLEVIDGYENGPKLGKFCGNKVPPDILTTGSMAVIQFQSDDTINLKGFSLTFTEV